MPSPAASFAIPQITLSGASLNTPWRRLEAGLYQVQAFNNDAASDNDTFSGASLVLYSGISAMSETDSDQTQVAKFSGLTLTEAGAMNVYIPTGSYQLRLESGSSPSAVVRMDQIHIR
ncbi:MAG: hypothetical protein AAF663_00110 [Planctomycetota bacterium]